MTQGMDALFARRCVLCRISNLRQRVLPPIRRVRWRLSVSGMKFRTHKSRNMYVELKGVEPHDTDLLINRTFEEGFEVFGKEF